MARLANRSLSFGHTHRPFIRMISDAPYDLGCVQGFGGFEELPSLNQSDGNEAEAARRFGLHRRQLYEKSIVIS